MTEAIVVVETDDHDLLAQVYRLRVEAWRARTSAFPEMEYWSDAFDRVGRHWVVIDDQRPVAAARLTVHGLLADVPNAEVYSGLLPADLPGPIGVLTRLVVARSHAGRGLSGRLDSVRIDAARRAGCRHLIGETFSGLPRIDQMVRAGFEVLGPAGAYLSGPLAAAKATAGEVRGLSPAVVRLVLMASDF